MPSAAGELAVDALAGLAVGVFAGGTAGSDSTSLAGAHGRFAAVGQVPTTTDNAGPAMMPAAPSRGAGEALQDTLFADGWDNPLPG
jgi:hypothetical protein